MCYSFFIHSYFNGHLGCFHVLATVDCAAVTIGLQVTFSHPLHLFPRLRQLGDTVDQYLDTLHTDSHPMPVFYTAQRGDQNGDSMGNAAVPLPLLIVEVFADGTHPC